MDTITIKIINLGNINHKITSIFKYSISYIKIDMFIKLWPNIFKFKNNFIWEKYSFFFKLTYGLSIADKIINVDT